MWLARDHVLVHQVFKQLRLLAAPPVVGGFRLFGMLSLVELLGVASRQLPFWTRRLLARLAMNILRLGRFVVAGWVS